MPGAASTAMVSVSSGQSSEPSSRRSANPEFWSRCTGICLLRGTVSSGALVVSRDDAHNMLAELWSVRHSDAREKFAKSLSSLGPDAKPQPRPGFFDLAFLPGVLWYAKVPGCLLDAIAWNLFMQKTVAGGPRSRRGTSLEEAEQQQPRGRSSGRRVPEGAYAEAAAKRGPAAKPMPAPKPKSAPKRKPSGKKAATVLREVEALHRRGSKRRNVSHRDEHEDVLSDIGDCGEEVENKPSYDEVKYTRKRAPGHDKRGRQVPPVWVGGDKYISEKKLERASPIVLGELVLDLGILQDRRGEVCPCVRSDGNACPGKLKLVVRDDFPSYRCSGGGGCQTFVRLLEGESDVFPDGVNAKDQLLLLWHWSAMSTEPNPRDVAMIMGMFPRTVRARFDRFRTIVAEHVEKVNNSSFLGGWDDADDAPVEVEIDEVLLRSRAELVEDSQAMVRTIRYCGMSERGNSKSVLLFALPDRVVEAGGGGPISSQELDDVLRVAERPDEFRLRPKTLIHTDSARAYFNLGWREAKMTPLDDAGRNAHEAKSVQEERHALERVEGIYLASLPEDSALASLTKGPASLADQELVSRGRRRADPTWADRYRPQEWMHTAVVHKKKKGFKRQFVCFRKVVTPAGKVFWVKGGTQQIDGHWRRLKNNVTRSAVNTRLRGRLHQLVRTHQWRHWNLDKCRFSEMGKVLSARREQASIVEVRGTARFASKCAQRKAAAGARRCARSSLPPLLEPSQDSDSSSSPSPAVVSAAPASRPAPPSPDFRDLPFDRKVVMQRPQRFAGQSKFKHLEEERRALLRAELEREGRAKRKG
jgi:hypothetical protein